jgi:hypothetical protein
LNHHQVIQLPNIEAVLTVHVPEHGVLVEKGFWTEQALTGGFEDCLAFVLLYRKNIL